MKSFSPAGMASKALFGYSRELSAASNGFSGGAQTFGNPAGATRGGGAYPAGGANPDGPDQGGGGTTPTQPFKPKLGTQFLGDPIVDIAIGDATHAVIVSLNGNVGFSADNGATWTRVSPVGGGMFQVAVSPGNVFVASDSDTFKLFSSPDGLSWTDVTPGGFAPLGIFWSAPGSTFVSFDSASATILTSPDGVTWTTQASPLANAFFQNGINNVAATAPVSIAGNFLVAGRHSGGSVALYTFDGVDWSQSNPTQAFQTNIISVQTDGTVFNMMGTGAGDCWDYQVPVNDAITPANWVLKKQTGSTTQAPYQTTGLWFSPLSLWVSGFDGTDFQSLATSPDGIIWTPVPVSVAGFSNANSIATDGASLFEYGTGIVMSADLATFTNALTLTAGFVNTVRRSSSNAVFAVGRDDAGNGQVWVLNSTTQTLDGFGNGGVGSTGPSFNGPGQTYFSADSSSAGTPSGFSSLGLTPDPFFIKGSQLAAFGMISTSPVNIPPNGLAFIVILATPGLPQNHFTSVSFTLSNGHSYTLTTASAQFNTPWDDTATTSGWSTWVWANSVEPFFPPPGFTSPITFTL